MNCTVIDVPQGSDDWRQLRCGLLTSSVACDMLAKIKTGEAAARRDLRLQLICERLTGLAIEDDFQSAAMRRGSALEGLARAAYEAHTGSLVRRTGFLKHPTLPCGYSPDGYLGNFDGLLECKVPKSATHLKYLRAGTMPAEYVPQITHALWITGAAWCDFVSWDGRFPPELQLFIVRVKASDVDLAGYESALRHFLAEVETELQAVRCLRNLSAVLKEAVA